MDDNIRIDQQQISLGASREPVSPKTDGEGLGHDIRLGPPVKEQTTAQMREDNELGISEKTRDAAFAIISSLHDESESYPILDAMGLNPKQIAYLMEEAPIGARGNLIEKMAQAKTEPVVKQVTSQPAPKTQKTAHASTLQYASVIVAGKEKGTADAIAKTLKEANASTMSRLLTGKRDISKMGDEEILQNLMSFPKGSKERFQESTRVIMGLPNARARELLAKVDEREKPQSTAVQEVAQDKGTIPEAPPVPVMETPPLTESTVPEAPTLPTEEAVATAPQEAQIPTPPPPQLQEEPPEQRLESPSIREGAVAPTPTRSPSPPVFLASIAGGRNLLKPLAQRPPTPDRTSGATQEIINRRSAIKGDDEEIEEEELVEEENGVEDKENIPRNENTSTSQVKPKPHKKSLSVASEQNPFEAALKRMPTPRPVDESTQTEDTWSTE